MKIGVDTTFLVQVLLREHPGHTAAREEMDRRLAAGDTFVMPRRWCQNWSML